jgi:hypothetical protein
VMPMIPTFVPRLHLNPAIITAFWKFSIPKQRSFGPLSFFNTWDSIGFYVCTEKKYFHKNYGIYFAFLIYQGG